MSSTQIFLSLCECVDCVHVVVSYVEVVPKEISPMLIKKVKGKEMVVMKRY